MSTAISVLSDVGLFLLGMTVMTEGLKGLAGSTLRSVLGTLIGAAAKRTVHFLRYHPLFPMIRQSRIRASFDSRCRLSTVKGLVVSRGPIPDCLLAKLEMTTSDLVGQPSSFCS
jgi:hypothetical protein